MGCCPESTDSMVNIISFLAVLIFGIASVTVNYYSLSCIFGTVAWACFYHSFRSLIEFQFPKTSALVTQADTSWSIAGAYVSFFHQFAVCFTVGAILLARYSDEKSWWQSEMGGSTWYMRRLEQQLFFTTMGYELKDFMRSPFPDIGLIIHHVFTVLGCVLCLLLPAGVGLVCMNCIDAQVGSGFFNAYVFYPARWNFWLFVAMMSVSNAVAIWLFFEFLTLNLSLVWFMCYGIVVFALALMRQGNVIIMCVDHAKNGNSSTHTSDEIDPLARKSSIPSGTMP